MTTLTSIPLATNNIIPIPTSMQAPAAFFGTNDVSGFVSVFVIYEGKCKAQIDTLQQLVKSEPTSPSGLGAARWLESQNIAAWDTI
jgi:hypothetical protein